MSKFRRKERKIEIKKMRKSNIELLRIVLIIMVIAHHYVVNSGIKAFFTPAKMSAKMIGIEIFGCGGKIAIDGFISITGFLCVNNQSHY